MYHIVKSTISGSYLPLFETISEFVLSSTSN